MELGANRKSLTQLGIAIAVLAVVLYLQFFREAPGPQGTRPSGAPAAGAVRDTAGPATQSRPPARSRGGRFEPRLGDSSGQAAGNPMAADVELRTDRLEKLRGIEAPTVERDIFNFGRPKRPAVEPVTASESRLAQAKLEEALRKAALSERQRPQPEPAARPPDWNYYGLASGAGSGTRRAFLLNGEEILTGERGTVLGGRYRIERIGEDALVLADLTAGRDFTIPLETSR